MFFNFLFVFYCFIFFSQDYFLSCKKHDTSMYKKKLIQLEEYIKCTTVKETSNGELGITEVLINDSICFLYKNDIRLFWVIQIFYYLIFRAFYLMDICSSYYMYLALIYCTSLSILLLFIPQLFVYNWFFWI